MSPPKPSIVLERERCPITTEQIHAGQAVYTPNMLAIYDVLVLGLSNRWIWKCPTPRLLAHYDRHVSGNHLDVGVGTGYFLDRCRFPTATPRVALMDLNRDALQFSARRIARYEPETYVRNVLETIDFDGAKFDSLGVNYLLHCLPGDMATKARAFDCLSPLMSQAPSSSARRCCRAASRAASRRRG